MKNDQFRTPLFQSGAILVVVVFLFALMPSSEAAHSVSGISAIFWGIVYAVIFPIALVFALLFSLAVLTVIVLSTVALYSPSQASEMYSGLKEKLSVYWNDACVWYKGKASQWCCQGISPEEHTRLKNDLAVLHRKNLQLENELLSLRAINAQLRESNGGRVDQDIALKS